MMSESKGLLKSFQQVMSEVSITAVKVDSFSQEDILNEFLEVEVNPKDYPIVALHHVGLYIGDYRDEEEVDLLEEKFLAAQHRGELKLLGRGPSYLAPRYYGTPGWWFSVIGPGDKQFELFTCRRYGKWAEYPVRIRASLMSHYALAVESFTGVKSMLDNFEQIHDLKTLVYTTHSEHGETYGHVMNPRNNQVLEIIFSSTQLTPTSNYSELTYSEKENNK